MRKKEEEEKRKTKEVHGEVVREKQKYARSCFADWLKCVSQVILPNRCK